MNLVLLGEIRAARTRVTKVCHHQRAKNPHFVEEERGLVPRGGTLHDKNAEVAGDWTESLGCNLLRQCPCEEVVDRKA